jgi:hypothetical protein
MPRRTPGKWPRLFEFEDQRWLPCILRNQMTDALRYLIVEMKIYDPIIPEFLWVMQKSRTKKVVDLCSGGTGPWHYLLGAIGDLEEVVERVTLTDLYPNENALKTLVAHHHLFAYTADSVNALDIDVKLEGVRTIFSSFHHFDTAEAISILQDAVDKKMPICVFEFTERRLVNLLITPISMVVLFAKLLCARPLTMSKFLFCLVLPIVPLIYIWDSAVSHLRSYSREELQALVGCVDNAGTFVWEIGQSTSPKTPLKNTFLIGYPKKRPAATNKSA